MLTASFCKGDAVISWNKDRICNQRFYFVMKDTLTVSSNSCVCPFVILF